MNQYFFILAILFATSASAGEIVGNGGDVIVCPEASWVEGRDDSQLQRKTCAYAGLKPVAYQEVKANLKKLMQLHAAKLKEEVGPEFGLVYALYSTAAKKVFGYFVNKAQLTEEDDASRAVHTLCKI